MPRVHIHATCWNEERMLPFFLRHYVPIAERIYIYDDGSTDRSLEILKQCSKVTIEPIRCDGNSYVEALQHLYNACWKRSRGIADWVIVCNVDEHFYHPSGLAAYLSTCLKAGITMIPSDGYEMVSFRFPRAKLQLSHAIRRGAHSSMIDKMVIFSPDAIEDTNFGVGRHVVNPVGRVVLPDVRELCLLHYKYLGFRYLSSRYAQLGSRRRPRDREKLYGYQYSIGNLRLLREYVGLLARARRVVADGGVN